VTPIPRFYFAASDIFADIRTSGTMAIIFFLASSDLRICRATDQKWHSRSC